MFSVYTDKLRSEVETIKAALVTHDRVRGVVYSADGTPIRAGAAGTDPFAEVKADAPPLLAWRVYDHCAAYTRLYAVYERFVHDAVLYWLSILPDLYSQYDALPDAVRVGHRVGVGQILTKLGGDRYAHLSEDGVISGIADGLAGKVPYALLPDAFLSDETNLWRETLDGLLRRIGVESAWGWIVNHAAIQKFIEDVRGNASSADSELRGLVQYRNEAAHGAVDQVVATEDIRKTADFVLVLCGVIAELMMRAVVMRRRELGHAVQIGRVIHRFSNQVIGVRMESATVAVGDELIVLNEQACYKVKVESIQIERQSHDRVQVTTSQNVGLRVTRSARVDSELLALAIPGTPTVRAGISDVAAAVTAFPIDLPAQAETAHPPVVVDQQQATGAPKEAVS